MRAVTLRISLLLAALALLVASSSSAHAQSADPDGPAAPSEPLPPTEPLPAEPAPVPVAPSDPEPAPIPAPRAAPPEIPPGPEPMSEGRLLVSAYNSGFQWGIAPGVIFSRGKAGFAIGLRFGYGFDTGPVIVVPGVRLSAYFIDPNVYIGMPTVKLVFPIDRFAPFVEGGFGLGHVADSKTGTALFGGGGFMIHFRPIAFGAEASYQTITGTRFRGFGIGPILAIGF